MYQELAVLPFFRIKRKHKRPEKEIPAPEPMIISPESKKRPRTLSSEKRKLEFSGLIMILIRNIIDHEIPCLSRIALPAPDLLGTDHLGQGGNFIKNDLVAVDSFLQLSVDDVKQHEVETTAAADHDDIISFVPRPHHHHQHLDL